MQLSEEYHILAELFTILPRDSYSAPFLCRYFPDITGSEAELRIQLSAMSEGGWLEADEDGWSILYSEKTEIKQTDGKGEEGNRWKTDDRFYK